MSDVNVPLLRKAVEWAEAEAAKPPEIREWEQGIWVLDNPSALDDLEAKIDGLSSRKAPECGTCYCIAGYTAQVLLGKPAKGWETERVARHGLGLALEDSDALFHCDNTIEDVRRIAEEIAGERL